VQHDRDAHPHGSDRYFHNANPSAQLPASMAEGTERGQLSWPEYLDRDAF
jgi:hypothetical protein